MPPQPWHVYVLYCIGSGRLYTSISKEPYKRLRQHNEDGKTSTWRLVWTKKCDDKRDAQKLELLIKKMKRTEKLLLVGLAA